MSERTVRIFVAEPSGGVRMAVQSSAAMYVRVGVQGGGTLNLAAKTAERLLTPRQIGLSGDATGSARFDGSEDISIATAVERLTNEDLEGMLL